MTRTFIQNSKFWNYSREISASVSAIAIKQDISRLGEIFHILSKSNWYYFVASKTYRKACDLNRSVCTQLDISFYWHYTWEGTDSAVIDVNRQSHSWTSPNHILLKLNKIVVQKEYVSTNISYLRGIIIIKTGRSDCLNITMETTWL